MKCAIRNRVHFIPGVYALGSAGFAMRDLMVVLGIVFALLVVASMLLPRFARACCKAQRISCVNNLKQVGTAYRVWAGDRGDRLPWNDSVTNEGWKELAFSTNAGRYCWTNFAVMANELGQSPRVMICPADVRDAATNFTVMKDNRSISYFVGINADDSHPQSLLGGDRNIGPGTVPKNDYGYSPDNYLGNSVIIQTNWKIAPITWTLKLHSAGTSAGAGDLLLGDGSVLFASSERLRWDYQAYAGVTLARDPEPSERAKPYTAFKSFRLVFP